MANMEVTVKLSETIKPMINVITELLEEINDREIELDVVRKVARENKELSDKLLENEQQLRIENHNLQLFIEEHVPEEKKKLIFNN